jgi:hypothetical protein
MGEIVGQVEPISKYFEVELVEDLKEVANV